MSGLVCTECDLTTTHADAYFHDREKTCNGTEHEWEERGG